MILSTIEDNKLIKTPLSTVDFAYECDVLCVGAGTAGVYSARSASSQGAKVILIENGQSVGGTHTEGNVHGYYYGFNGGEFEKDDATCQKNQKFFFDNAFKDNKQIVMLEQLKETGVQLLTKHTPLGVLFEQNRVVGLWVTDGVKPFYIKSAVCIDCTADGYLIQMTDTPKTYGRDVDGKTVPFSVIANYVWNNIRCGVNEDAGHVNQYDSEDFSKKILLAHKNSTKHFNKGDFLSLASHTGVREGLSFEGEEKLCYQDILLRKKPEKVLFWAYSDLDRHGNDRALDDELFQRWWVISNLATVTTKIAVPLGSVVPKGIKGLFSAGRCFSVDTYGQSAVRMIRDMFRMGECVGVLSALAVKTNGDFNAVNYDEYLDIVKTRGGFNGDTTKDFGFDYPGKQKPYKAIKFDAYVNLPLLKTETPGVAIWSCYLERDNQSLKDTLFNLMQNAENNLERYNYSLALGNANDERALPVLREIIRNRDCFYFTDCRRSNQFRSASALCLLGLLGKEKDIDLLEQLVFDENEIEKELYHTLEPNYLYYKHGDRNFVYFDIFTHSANSLVRLYKKFNKSTKALNLRFKRLKEEGAIFSRIAPNALPHEPAFAEIQNFIEQMILRTEE